MSDSNSLQIAMRRPWAGLAGVHVGGSGLPGCICLSQDYAGHNSPWQARSDAVLNRYHEGRRLGGGAWVAPLVTVGLRMLKKE